LRVARVIEADLGDERGIDGDGIADRTAVVDAGEEVAERGVGGAEDLVVALDALIVAAREIEPLPRREVVVEAADLVVEAVSGLGGGVEVVLAEAVAGSIGQGKNSSAERATGLSGSTPVVMLLFANGVRS
jgi:hypothetical protein